MTTGAIPVGPTFHGCINDAGAFDRSGSPVAIQFVDRRYEDNPHAVNFSVSLSDAEKLARDILSNT